MRARSKTIIYRHYTIRTEEDGEVCVMFGFTRSSYYTMEAAKRAVDNLYKSTKN